MRAEIEDNGLCRAGLLAQVGGNAELLMELMDIFQEDAPQQMAEIRKALQHGNARQLYLSAHSFSGTLCGFGKSPAFAAARQLEALGQIGDLTRAAELLAHLEQAVRQLAGVLARMTAPNLAEANN